VSIELAPRPKVFQRWHRPVLIDLALLDELELRTATGKRLVVHWGNQVDGVYEPTLTEVDDGKVIITRAALAELERRAAGSE
jgi:hypothetical protein